MNNEVLINDYYKRIKENRDDFFQILGVTPKSLSSEIHQGYSKIMEQFKSIKIADDQNGYNDKLSYIISRIDYMYSILSDYDKRLKYEEMGNRDIDQKELVPDDPIKEGRDFFKQGVDAFQKNKFVHAFELFTKAISKDPEKAAYYHKLGMCQIKIPELRRDAQKNFLKAIELEAWNAEFHASLGWLFYLEKYNQKAESCLRKALELDAENPLARKILNIIAPAREKSFKGVLKKVMPSLFKK